MSILWYPKVKYVERGGGMAYNYNNLWKILIDKKMLKKDLIAQTGINAATMAKMGKELPVNLDVIGRICCVLNIGIGDVVEYIPDIKKANEASNELNGGFQNGD